MVVLERDLPIVAPPLIERASRWEELKRWERRELAQGLRALGLSYKEIGRVIPVGKGTLSAWCRDVALDEEQWERLRMKRPSLAVRWAVGAKRRAEALDRAAALRASAREQVPRLRNDPMWVAGVVAYWSEGAKRTRELRFSNSDPRLVLLFIRWCERYLGRHEFSAKLHLHSGQDDPEHIAYWSEVTGIPRGRFGKTYVKPEGTGHRKNRLYRGTITVRASRSGADLHRMLGWIDGLSDLGRTDSLAPGR